LLPPRDTSTAQDLLIWAEDYYGKSFDGFTEDNLFYEGQLEPFVETTENMPVTIPTTGRAVIDEAVDSIVPADILVLYPPRGVTSKAERDADAARRWIKAAWTHIRTASADIDPVRDFARNLFAHGKACLKVVPDYTLWPVLEDEDVEELRKAGPKKAKEELDAIREMRAGNFPLTVRSLPPECVMEDPTVNTRKLWICERYNMSNSEVRSLYSQQVEEFRGQEFWGYNSYIVHELWTATYRTHAGKLHKGKHWIFINYEKVVEEDSPYDDLPYVLKYSGFGREAYEGSPEYKSVGFFTRQVKSMLLAQARRATAFDAIMSQFAYPIAFMDDTVEDADISLAPGAVNFVPAGILANMQNTFVKAPVLAPEYLQSLNFMDDQIERGTVQRSVRGASMPGADSAAQYSLQSNNAKLRMESCKQACEQALSSASQKMLRYVDGHLKDDVSVFVIDAKVSKYTLGPSNIRGNHNVGITFMPNEDAIKERKLILANDAINKGGLSPYDAYTFAGFENASELIERRMAYDVLMSDEVKKYVARDLLKKWGIDADMVEMEGKMKEQEQQFQLRAMANQMQLGTGAGQEGAQGPAPAPAGGQPPPQNIQQQGPTGPMGGQGGAPQQQMPAEVASMMGDLNAMQGGIAA